MWLWEDQDHGSFLGPFFVLLLLLLLLVMRDLFKACVLSFYILLLFFSFQQVQDLQVLKPRDLCRPRRRQPRCSGEYAGGHLQAAKNGATSVELDIEFTSDGFPVLMLNNTVDNRQVWPTM